MEDLLACIGAIAIAVLLAVAGAALNDITWIHSAKKAEKFMIEQTVYSCRPVSEK